MKYRLFLAAIVLIGNAQISAADFFENLTQKSQLEIRVRGLPIEVQKRIFFMALDGLKKRNQEAIKAYVKESLEISDYNKTWYNIQHYFAFKNYGLQCTHIITFVAKKGSPLDHGIVSKPCGDKIVGSFGIVFMHILEPENLLKPDSITTIDCLAEEKQIEAPCDYNGIHLNEKKPGWVYWLSRNYLQRDCKIKKDDKCPIQ